MAGISPDSVSSHESFREKNNLTVQLLSDSGHAMMEAYGAWGRKEKDGKEYFGVIRSTVLIDPAGIVRRHWPDVQPKGHAAEVLELFRELVAQGR